MHCHTAAAASTRVSHNLLPSKQVCLECHEDAAIPAPPRVRICAALPQMADGLVCHTQIEPLFSCEDCHGQDAYH